MADSETNTEQSTSGVSATAVAPKAGMPAIYRNLMAVGLLGVRYQAHADAQKVNDAVELTLQDPTLFRMYRAQVQGIGATEPMGQLQSRPR